MGYFIRPTTNFYLRPKISEPCIRSMVFSILFTIHTIHKVICTELSHFEYDMSILNLNLLHCDIMTDKPKADGFDDGKDNAEYV